MGESTRVKRTVVLLCRSIATVISVGALFLYVILLSKYNKREDIAGENSTGRDLYKYLPIGGLSLSIVWNGFSLITLGLRAARWLSNRFRNAVDVFAAIELAALGYVSFVYSLITEWHGGIIGGGEKVLQIVALTLLSLAGAAHLLFFCYDCAAHFFSPPLRRDEPESWLGQMPSYSDSSEKSKSRSQVSEFSSSSASHRNSFPRRSNSTKSSRSVEMEMTVKPLSLYRKSGGTGSLHKKSNSFIRPARLPMSVEVPAYTPNGFVTVLGNSHSEDDIQLISPVSPISPTSVPSHPPIPNPKVRCRYSNGSLSPPTSPNSFGNATTRFPVKVPVRAHTRSFSSISYGPEPLVGLSRSRSTSSPTSPFGPPPRSPLTTVPPTNPFTLKRMATPPIAEHPAFQRDVYTPDSERSTSPGPATTAWGGNSYRDQRTFIPAFQEHGSAFGDIPIAVSGSKAKKFIMP